MKSMLSTMRLLLVSLLLCLAASKAVACGPFLNVIPEPMILTSRHMNMTKADYNREENLRLWQQLTSTNIPLRDIEQAVYRDNLEQVRLMCTDLYEESPGQPPTNLLYRFIHNTCDAELATFLILAKELETRWNKLKSPWYYPASKDAAYNTPELDDIILRCELYKGTRIADRYRLQIIRALFASRAYDRCIERFDSLFADFPDDNLFKRMAMDYVGGAWEHLGDADKAREYYARAGGIEMQWEGELDADLAANHPDCPMLLKAVQEHCMDSDYMVAVIPIAERILREGRTKNRGDWEFVLAYALGEYGSNVPLARTHIRRAMQCKFSSKDFRDHARAYNMKLNGASMSCAGLLAELRWMESKMDCTEPDAQEWNRILLNVIYTGIVPHLWNRHDYATSILLAGYADNASMGDRVRHQYYNIDYVKDGKVRSMLCDVPIYITREQCDREYSYGSLSFQMMGSLTSGRLIDVKSKVAANSPLYVFLKKRARTEAAYFDELIGTLALREERYDRAMHYLALVPESYRRSMNICLYLSRDAFEAYPSRWSPGYSDDYEIEQQMSVTDFTPVYGNVKYDFAKKMAHLSHVMRHGRTADERGLARLHYAIGRRNSLEECWALTQYWRNDYVPHKFYPCSYWEDLSSSNSELYDFLYDYNRTVGHRHTEDIYESEVRAAMSMLRTDEAKAEAEYTLHNLKTIIKRYGNTKMAEHVRTSCDRWRQWL